MDGQMSRAYLEDPVAKRTFGYAIGDTVAGGRVRSISADRVVIARPDGLVEVLLQDPAKPRVAPPASNGAARAPSAPGPAAPGVPGAVSAAPRVELPSTPESGTR
jgi:hypothetical protein